MDYSFHFYNSFAAPFFLELKTAHVTLRPFPKEGSNQAMSK
jgi:hypothetical protein